MLSYLIVGSGYRAEFYGRIAGTWPELFSALFLCRSEEKAAYLRKKLNIPATASIRSAHDFDPDFVVAAVNKDSLADVALEWAQQGYPVLMETPAAVSAEKLPMLQAAHEAGARICVCEQYHRYPILAAGLKAIEEGRIGTPTSAYLSLAHDYHAASLIRRMLQTDGEDCLLRGETVRSVCSATDSRTGAVLDGGQSVQSRTVMHISFSSGKYAVYDFGGIQYHSYLYSRHLNVRGTKGEWSDTVLRRLDQDMRPRQELLLPEMQERYRMLDTQAFRDLRRTWSPDLGMETVQDEYAIASFLLDMGGYIAGGAEPYPFREAVWDAYFWLKMQEASARPWESIRVSGQTLSF